MMKRQLAWVIFVVSLMQFTVTSNGYSVVDEWDQVFVKREIDDGGDINGDYPYFDDFVLEKRASSGLTAAQTQKIVDVHNNLRRGEGASDMQLLKYSNRLAQLAQDWADRCNWGHRPQNNGASPVGENLWMATGNVASTIPEKPIQSWFNEKSGYVYNSDTCSRPPCGHYTAVVWATTQEVGCGLKLCPVLGNSGARNAYFFVCNYGPAGNMVGEKPFKKGVPCSECNSGQFYCTAGLCDQTCRQAGRGGGQCECKARCANGSPTPDCKCRCNPGYSGVRCNDLEYCQPNSELCMLSKPSRNFYCHTFDVFDRDQNGCPQQLSPERCVDKNPQCGANPGWPAKWCTDKNVFGGQMYDIVNKECPKMCRKCS